MRSILLGFAISSLALAQGGVGNGIIVKQPTPTTTPACTVTEYTAVPSATANCTNIVLKDITVPGNSTLNLSKLKAGTTITFAGTTVR